MGIECSLVVIQYHCCIFAARLFKRGRNIVALEVRRNPIANKLHKIILKVLAHNL